MNAEEGSLVAERRKHALREASDDGGLVAQAKSGCSGAFGQLCERHRLRVYRTTFRVLRQRQDAEDAVQRCFQRAFTNLSKFRGDATFVTWMTRIAINEALMLLRQRRSDKSLSDLENADGKTASFLDLADEAPSPEQFVVTNELRAAVSQAVSHLRKNLRTVVVLRELQGLTNEETARRLGLTVTCVKARLFHARRWLRRRLERRLKPARNGTLISL